MEDFEEDKPYQSALSSSKIWEMMEQYIDELKLLLGMNYYFLMHNTLEYEKVF